MFAHRVKSLQLGAQSVLTIPMAQLSRLSQSFSATDGLKYRTENRGRALSIGGPGARDEIADVGKYVFQHHSEILVKQNDGNCITAAIVVVE